MIISDCQEDGDKSVSTSGSNGSPSISGAGMGAIPCDSTVLRLRNLEIEGVIDSGSRSVIGGRKKKGGHGATGTDKRGLGLRKFSVKVCEKVESKGRTTYNEVADELVAEFADASKKEQGYEDKNIRRRVYDALNVLMALDIVTKDKKEIQWSGLPRTSVTDMEEIKVDSFTELQTETVGLKHRIEKKAAYLHELKEQFLGYQNLIQRNQQLSGNGNPPTGGVALPFILVQTKPNATVEVEISEDMQLVHFDFSSTPFELHDDSFVLKQMEYGEEPRLAIEDFNPPSCLMNAYHPQTSDP